MSTHFATTTSVRSKLIIRWFQEDFVVKATVDDQAYVPEFQAELVQNPPLPGALIFLNPIFSLAAVEFGRLIFMDDSFGGVALYTTTPPPKWEGGCLMVTEGFGAYIRLEREVRHLLDVMFTEKQRQNAKNSVLLQLVTNETLYRIS
jgi:hypothetical protein